ncbi:hypothetical protein HO173_003158 [Letharia columbiana]|uniref:JmjC domain-containing protein n=1 Tax=Letharia columbiana TaxID=112416 RepID=A0A8H6G1C9_9LECA|nr:uncharacterized protein HO173_003158 [Letharia columbiana]KAF6238652.1 hypothetical protein HO173_003158 [Letharia columbiana]
MDMEMDGASDGQAGRQPLGKRRRGAGEVVRKDTKRKRAEREERTKAQRCLGKDSILVGPEPCGYQQLKFYEIEGTILEQSAHFGNRLHCYDSLEARSGNEWDLYDTRLRAGMTGIVAENVRNLWPRVSAQYRTEEEKRTPHISVQIITTGKQLNDVLTSQKMEVPAFIPAKSTLGESFQKDENIPKSIDAWLARHKDTDKVAIQSYDMKADKDNDLLLPTPTTIGELKERQKMRLTAEGTPWNCLDVGNYTGSGWTPPVIAGCDLYKRSMNPAGSLSRTTHDTLSTEFALCATKGAMSKFHSDNGLMTFITNDHGVKIFYTGHSVAHMPQEDLDRFIEYGADESQGYSRSFAKLRLGKGDSIILPPGFVHAVYTEEDSFVRGCFFLTQPNVPWAIRTVRFLEDHPQCTNDDLSAQVFATFAMHCEHNIERGRSGGQLDALLMERMKLLAWALQAFVRGKPPHLDKTPEYMEERRVFVARAKKEGWVKELMTFGENQGKMSHPT